MEEKTTTEGLAKGNEFVNTGTQQKGTHINIGEELGPEGSFLYTYVTSKEQLNDNSITTLFFLENEIHHGAKMNLFFTKNTNLEVKFLSRHVSDSIPFLSDKLPKIYEVFSLDPNSIEPNVTKETIRICETAGIEGEEKYCATSLESMVDFTTAKLGEKMRAMSTELYTKESIPLQNYMIERANKLASNKTVVCHKQNYIYVVFYCHKTSNTRAYAVSFVGSDGTKVKAVSVCHTDTSKWNPKHLAFQVLKVKPGTVPVCHFLPVDHVVWVPY